MAHRINNVINTDGRGLETETETETETILKDLTGCEAIPRQLEAVRLLLLHATLEGDDMHFKIICLRS
jgi:hypothetical protein